jgi:putative hydrolase of HD superfamily
MENKYREIINFMGECEALKKEMRHSWLSNGRRESVAEHTWAATLMAILIMNELEQNIDQLKVLKMLTIHDLVEVYAGDMAEFEAMQGNQDKKVVAEKDALKKLLSKLSNKKTAQEIKDLWEEFEERKTREAKVAQACDKAEAIVQHNLANIDSFSQGDYDINPFYKADYFKFDKFIDALKKVIDLDSMTKIENEGDITRVSKKHLQMWEEIKDEQND